MSICNRYMYRLKVWYQYRYLLGKWYSLIGIFPLLASGEERRNALRRVDRRRELPVIVIWENRTTS